MPESYLSSYFDIDPEEHIQDSYQFGFFAEQGPVDYTFDLENYIQGHWMSEWGHYLPELDTAELNTIRNKNRQDINQTVQTDIRELMNNRFSSVLNGTTAADTLELISDKKRLETFKAFKKEDKFTGEYGEEYIDMVSDLDELGAFDFADTGGFQEYLSSGGYAAQLIADAIGPGTPTQESQVAYSESGDMNAGLCYASCPDCFTETLGGWTQECYQCMADCAEAIDSDY